MITNFEKIKNYLFELGYEIIMQDFEKEMLMIEKPDAGIQNLILDCEDPILIVEMHLFDMKKKNIEALSTFLKMNRNIVHGAIALDETGGKVIFRDTLQLENLDINELQGTLNSIEIFLSENAEKLIQLSKKF